jgi:hypothetical protein
MDEPDDGTAVSRLARPYTLTGGRTRPTHTHLDVATMVVVAGSVERRDVDQLDLEPELRRIVALCQRPTSVAEIAARGRVPLTVAKIQLSDLIDRGLLVVGLPPAESALPTLDVLQAVLDGLQATL